MLTVDRLTVHLHDDTALPLPDGTRYTLTAAGVHYVTPDGTADTVDAWDVLRVDAYTTRTPGEGGGATA